MQSAPVAKLVAAEAHEDQQIRQEYDAQQSDTPL